MAEEETLDEGQETPDQGQQYSAEESLRRQVAALEKKLKATERQAKWSDLRAKHSHITEEDAELFKGIPVEKWEGIVSRIAPPASQATQDGPDGQTKPQVSQEERSAIEGVTKPLEATGGKAKITFAEAKAMGGPLNPQVEQLIRDGLVEGLRPSR